MKEIFAPEDKALESALKSIEENNIRPINVGADEAKLIQILIKLHGSKTVIEVGTLVGYSTIWIARALPDDGKIFTFEYDEKVAEIAKRNIGISDVAHKIEVITGNAHEKLKEIESKGPFDCMFIDAEKGGYCKYLDWAEVNIRNGGLILGDNAFMFGLVYDDELQADKYKKEVPVMKEFNKRLADQNRYDSVIVTNVEGLAVAVKKF